MWQIIHSEIRSVKLRHSTKQANMQGGLLYYGISILIPKCNEKMLSCYVAIIDLYTKQKTNMNTKIIQR